MPYIVDFETVSTAGLESSPSNNPTNLTNHVY